MERKTRAESFDPKERQIKSEKKLLAAPGYNENKERILKMDNSKIYSKTTFLDQKAVSYLVISSSYKEIKASDSCFPLVGCFPYIGFFRETSANNYVKKRELEGQHVWKRPVYAYSTLGYFEDTILSSFFYYNQFDLAELIFHELFHTIFFVKGEVDLNENLANYFGKQLRDLYFLNTKGLEEYQLQSQNEHRLNQLVVRLAKKLSQNYKEIKNSERTRYEKRLESFLDLEFYPQIKNECEKLGINSCYPLQ